MTDLHPDRFYFGTQYYRAPTPLPDEWAGDIKNIAAMNMDCFQIRILWRQNERVKGVYEFDDVDKLLELARQHKLKVVIKFLLENAPDYVFEEFNGATYRPDGTKIGYDGNGAFYLGGHRPCFDNPQVMAHAVKFVHKTVERYKDNPDIIFWNIWNEPRIHTGECACEHSLKAYRDYLRNRFGSIEALNKFAGKAWDSFDSIQAPTSYRTYSDMFLWRQWSHTTLTGWLRTLRDAVRDHDTSRPVMAHVGCCNLVNEPIEDCTDDVENAKLFDFYGTSFSIGEKFNKGFELAMPFMIGEWLRNASEYFWVHELYPEWGDWSGRLPVKDFRYKVMTALSSSCKGLVLWQYRAERLGHENDLAGVVNIDGSSKPITYECEDLIKLIGRHRDFLYHAKAQPHRIGILFDLSSNMISSVENRNGDGSLKYANGGVYPYMDNIHGIYTLMHELKLAPQIFDSRLLKEKINNIDILYLPAYFMPTDENLQLIREFADRGGQVIAEEGFALRQQNTWLNYPWPGGDMIKEFGVKIDERVATDKVDPWGITVNGIEAQASGYASALEIVSSDVQVLANWHDGRPAVTRRGNYTFIGTTLGCMMYHKHGNAAQDANNAAAARAMLKALLQDHIDLPDLPESIAVRKLCTAGETGYFVFNRAHESVSFMLDGNEITIDARDSALVINGVLDR
ncbi:MAG: hypothetical protein E7047_00740 [Lentisphaerae bacterium]|nr:hypothetical protein [Lentisphaerota bacterium]